MEEFDDDDCSDLYADVELQASTAISAMHQLTVMRRGDDKIFGNVNRGEKEFRGEANGAEIARGNHKFYKNDAGGGGVGGCLKNLPMENGDMRESESEDDWDSGDDDGYKQKFDDDCDNGKYDDRASDVEFGVRNGNKCEGGQEIDEEEKTRGGDDGNEKSVNGGGYSSQRKNLKYDSLNSKKRRVDEIARHVHKSCKKVDADVGNDRALCFSRAIEDNQPNFGRKYGGPDSASESSRNAHARDPVPLDLDKCGSVQISDSVEDNKREASESDYGSDGMSEATETSDDTNRRKTSSLSNKVSSSVEHESSRSDWSQHRRGSSYSPSPCVAHGDKYMKKSPKYSRHHSSSLSREHHPSKDSKSCGIKRDTRDGRYCERRRGVTRNHSNQPKKSNDMPYLKTHWPSEDASYATDVKRLYNRHVSYGKQRSMVSFDSNGNPKSYCSESERLAYSRGFFPDYRSGPTYLKNQCWKGWPDGPNMSERQNFLEKKNRRRDYEALEDDWYHNQRRYFVQGNIEESRKLIPKYSSAVNQRGTQFIYEGDDMHSRRRTKEDYLSPRHESDNKFVEGKFRKFCFNSGRDRDRLDHRRDRDIAHDRREMESFGRGKRRHDGLVNGSDNLWHFEPEVNERRNIKHRPFPFHSPEELRAPGKGQYLGASAPKSGVPEWNMRCSWKEMHMENGRNGTNFATSDPRESFRYYHSEDHHVGRRHFEQSSNTYIVNKSIKDDRDEDHFHRRRNQQNSEVLALRGDVYKSRQQDDAIFQYEEPSYNFTRISRDNRADDRHAFGRVAEFIDEREVYRQRSKMMREEDHSNQFDGHAQMHPKYQVSVDRLVVVGRKCTSQSSRRTSEAGEDTYYGRRELMGWNDNKKSQNSEESEGINPENACLTNEANVNTCLSNTNQPSKFSGNQQDEFLDIEEGQIITEEIEDLVKRAHASEDTSQINDKVHPETVSNDNTVALDDQKIREIMVKMERRRQRFKEPVITLSRECEKTSNPLPDLEVETAMAKLERPARKRRWSGT